jgi:protein-tyrosine phosphatase
MSADAGLWTVETSGGGAVSIAPRPFGGDRLGRAMRAFREAGVDVLISALGPTEAAELGLGGERAAAEGAGMDFRPLPIADMSVPSDTEAFLGALTGLAARVREGEHVAVHCYASVGRSGIISSLLLVLCGWEVETALATLSAVRGRPVPETDEQRAWVRRAAELIRSEA